MKYIRMHVVEAEPARFGDEDGYRVFYPDGYESWCPKEQFEEAGRLCDGMTFGMAIEAMRRGKKVARKGWNGKGMYVWLMPGSVVKGCKTITDKHLADVDKAEGEIRFLDSLRMRTVDGSVLTGWLASQTDILAEDWQVVE